MILTLYHVNVQLVGGQNTGPFHRNMCMSMRKKLQFSPWTKSSLYHTVNLLVAPQFLNASMSAYVTVGPADESSHSKNNGRKAHCIIQ